MVTNALAEMTCSGIQQGNQHESAIIAYRFPIYVTSSRRSAEFRRAFQRQLTDAGLYGGPIDGQFGPAVMRALDTLQQRAAIPR